LQDAIVLHVNDTCDPQHSIDGIIESFEFQSGDKDSARVDKAEPLLWLKAGWFCGIREGQMSQ
jgi:hypothetical protein